jgi:hypothetical protein
LDGAEGGGMKRYDEREGYIGGDGESRDIEPEPRVFYVGDGNPGRFGFRRARMGKRTGSPSVSHPTSLPPASQLFPVHLLPLLFSKDTIRCPLSLPPKPLLSSTQPPSPRHRRLIIGKFVQAVNFGKQLTNAEARPHPSHRHP